MRALLGAHGEVEGLEGKGLAAIELAEQVEHARIGGDRVDVAIEAPGILDAALALRFVAFGIGEIDPAARAETGLDPLDPRLEPRIGEVEHGIAAGVQIEPDPRLLFAKVKRGQERRK